MIGLEDVGYTVGLGGEDCCFTGEREESFGDWPTPLAVGFVEYPGKAVERLLCGGESDGRFAIGDGISCVEGEELGRWRWNELRNGF